MNTTAKEQKMLGIGKRREFLLKLLCITIFLAALSFTGSNALWLGVLFVLVVGAVLNLKSTDWIIKKLDLRPEAVLADDLLIKARVDELAKKYEIKIPRIYIVKQIAPLVLAVGDSRYSFLVVSKGFFDKLSLKEKDALLELSITKIESGFCKNIEFVTHLNSTLLYIGSKLDLVIALITGIKKNKTVETQHYILFSRIAMVFVRSINYFYMNEKVFYNFDTTAFQNNKYLLLALNKTALFSPLEKKSFSPLLNPFNFCNFPRYVKWQKHLEAQPSIESRLATLQNDQKLMLESLTI